MSQTLASRLLPWVAASFVTSAAFLATDFLLWYDFYPIASAANAALGWLPTAVLDLTELVVSALFVGNLVRRRFEYPLGGIFLTCIATSFLVSLAILQGPFRFAGSAIVSIVVAALIAAGAALGRSAMAKRQILSVNPQ